MAHPDISDDPRLPVLTEVLDVPFPADPPAAASALDAPVTEIAAFEAPEPEPVRVPAPEQSVETYDESLFTDMRAALLSDLKARIDPILRERLQAHLALAVDRALDEVMQHAHDEIAQMLDEGLNKELIRRAAVLEPQRARPRTDTAPD